eukprot:GHRR01026651.1.p1 GENE.GHRR01026651.1~~GHRR01026651.1.p1  ORF type:complete len:106 (-),score=29.42 GHRR01026651.1:147-464(-)
MECDHKAAWAKLTGNTKAWAMLTGPRASMRLVAECYCMPAGPDTFFARVGKDALIKTALLPALTIGIKSAGSQMPGLQSVKDVSLAVLAPAVGVVFKAVRALAPY